jgi:hypothetical protein
MGNGLFLAAVQLETLSSAQLLPMGNFGQLPKYAVTSDFILVQDLVANEGKRVPSNATV